MDQLRVSLPWLFTPLLRNLQISSATANPPDLKGESTKGGVGQKRTEHANGGDARRPTGQCEAKRKDILTDNC